MTPEEKRKRLDELQREECSQRDFDGRGSQAIRDEIRSLREEIQREVIVCRDCNFESQGGPQYDRSHYEWCKQVPERFRGKKPDRDLLAMMAATIYAGDAIAGSTAVEAARSILKEIDRE